MPPKRLEIPRGQTINISGSKVVVDGVTAHNSLDCYEIVIQGDVELLSTDANVNATNVGKVICRGSCKVSGDCLGDIDAQGSVKIAGNHHGAKLRAGGSIKIGGDAKLTNSAGPR